MIRKIKNIVWKVLNVIGLGGPVQLILKSGLKEDGWFKSFVTKRSIDRNGDPIPWNTYPYIKFIGPRLTKEMDMFEYGSGNSTIWYAARAGSIKAVENDKVWYGMISKKIPANAEIVYRDLNDGKSYEQEVTKSDKKYHVVVIDGRERVNSLKNSLQKLTEDGVLVFDNSDLSIYDEAHVVMKENGFKKIDFIGLSPVTAHTNYTTIFYRANNCLGI